jgi:hypothetical protein
MLSFSMRNSVILKSLLRSGKERWSLSGLKKRGLQGDTDSHYKDNYKSSLASLSSLIWLFVTLYAKLTDKIAKQPTSNQISSRAELIS